MIEVFVAYRRIDDIKLLGDTLDAWALDGMEPSAIEVNGKRFELQRRVAAENISTGHYILADLGYGPLEENFGELAENALNARPDVGLFGAWRIGQAAGEIPNSVIVCRRGVIKQWPQAFGGTYVREHSEAYRLAGYKTFLCSTLHYHPLAVTLPC